MGVRLYRRPGQKVLLTPTDEALLPYSKSLLTQHDAAITAVRELAGKGLVRIGTVTGPAMSSYLLPVVLRRYRRALPNVEVMVESQHTSELIRRLTRQSLDLILAHSFLHEDRNVCVKKAWPVEFVFVCNTPQVRRASSLSDLRFSFCFISKRL